MAFEFIGAGKTRFRVHAALTKFKMYARGIADIFISLVMLPWAFITSKKS